MLITVTKTPDVLAVTINRPDKRNALSHAVVEELSAVLGAHRKDTGLKLLVLSGEGDKAFASGGDLKELAAIRTHTDAVAMSKTFRAALDAVRTFPVPTVAAINGDALGGGAELAMACDLRVAAPHARIGFLQGKLAISTAWGGGIDLLHLVGVSRALRFMGLAEIMSAQVALGHGLLDAVAPVSQPFATFVDEFCSDLRQRTPAVMRAFKALASAYRTGASHADLQRIETEHFATTWIHEDHWQAVEASFGRAGERK